MKKCSECVFAILHDFGYSNYEVEDTTVYCSKKLNQNGEFDIWYDPDKMDLFAEKCDKYIEGDPVHIDGDAEYGDRHYDIVDNLFWKDYATEHVTYKTIRDVVYSS